MLAGPMDRNRKLESNGLADRLKLASLRWPSLRRQWDGGGDEWERGDRRDVPKRESHESIILFEGRPNYVG